MSGSKNGTKIKATLALAFALAGCVIAITPEQASADYAPILGETNTMRTPLIDGAPYTNQMQAAPEGQPPPIGSGNNYRPVVQGDQGQPPAPPTGQHDPTHGNIFGTRMAPGPKDPAIYVPNAGRRTTKNGQDQGVYDYGQEEQGTETINNGGSANGATGKQNNGGPRWNAQGESDVIWQHQRQPDLFKPQWVLPTVPVFCRYLVMLGVVCATVFMAQAAMAMTMGHHYGGARVIGAAGGLLLLLAGYTIWKIVELNTAGLNSIGWESHYRDGTRQVLVQKGRNGNVNNGGINNNPFGGNNTGNGGAGNNNANGGLVPNPFGNNGPIPNPPGGGP